MGSMPPAAVPMRKHITRFQSKDGMKPQIEVATYISAENRIVERRPKRSAT